MNGMDGMNRDRGINSHVGDIGKTEPAEEEIRNKPKDHRYEPTVIDRSMTDNSAGESIPVTSIIEERELRVVGWMVSIYGNCKGKDYRLYTGMNFIGRGRREPGWVSLTDNRIHGAGELIVSYDPINNKFTIKPTEGGKCLAYINEKKYIDEKMTLSAYDCITLRDKSLENKNEVIARLMFVPLCCEYFTWNEGAIERNG